LPNERRITTVRSCPIATSADDRSTIGEGLILNSAIPHGTFSIVGSGTHHPHAATAVDGRSHRIVGVLTNDDMNGSVRARPENLNRETSLPAFVQGDLVLAIGRPNDSNLPRCRENTGKPLCAAGCCSGQSGSRRRAIRIHRPLSRGGPSRHPPRGDLQAFPYANGNRAAILPRPRVEFHQSSSQSSRPNRQLCAMSSFRSPPCSYAAHSIILWQARGGAEWRFTSIGYYGPLFMMICAGLPAVRQPPAFARRLDQSCTDQADDAGRS